MLECAVALVLLVDISGSVSTESYQLQHDGIATAFADARVQEAISMHDKGIAVSIIEWGDNQYISVPWTIIKNKTDSDHFASTVLNTEREGGMENTGIGNAILKGISYFDSAPCTPDNKVIDVSGDGYNNTGPDPLLITKMAAEKDITINGLAIVTPQSPDLYDYYRKNVMTLNGFVLKANGFEDFARTIRRKLITEISERSSFDSDVDQVGPI